MKMNKKIVFVLTVLLICIISITSVSALYYPDSFYNAISWTWTYDAPYTDDYNCLGYATGWMIWEWPWGGVQPTATQVDNYMLSFHFMVVNNSSPLIISYAKDGLVTHFSKVTGFNTCTAKWGEFERFRHASWNPYYPTSVYGTLNAKYGY